MKIDYLLTGSTQQGYIEVSGSGNIDQKDGSYTLDLNVFRAPKSWDPGIVILICSNNLQLYAARPQGIQDFASKRSMMKSMKIGTLVNSDRKGTFQTASGEYVVSMSAKGFLFIENGTVFSRSVIREGFSRLEEFGGIKQINIPYSEKITPLPCNQASGLSVYSLETGDGTLLHGSTIYPYVFDDGQIIDKECNINITEAVTNSQKYLSSGAKPSMKVRAEIS